MKIYKEFFSTFFSSFIAFDVECIDIEDGLVNVIVKNKVLYTCVHIQRILIYTKAKSW